MPQSHYITVHKKSKMVDTNPALCGRLGEKNLDRKVRKRKVYNPALCLKNCGKTKM